MVYPAIRPQIIENRTRAISTGDMYLINIDHIGANLLDSIPSYPSFISSSAFSVFQKYPRKIQIMSPPNGRPISLNM